MRNLLLGAACVVFVGCGDSASGLNPDKPLSSITAAETQQLCGWMVSKWGGENHERTCEYSVDGITATATFDLGTTAECVADAPGTATGCSATIEDVETCFAFYVDNLCTATLAQLESACAALQPCGLFLPEQEDPPVQ